MKKALITGITGQDGSYLAEFLLEKGYEVHGIVRRASISNTARIDHLIEKNAIHLHDGDLSDSSGLIRLVGEIKPDEIYNLAAQSHVQVSFDAPNHENPNLFSIGEGFGFFVFFGNENSGSFQTAVCPKPYQKKNRVTKVTTVKVP